MSRRSFVAAALVLAVCSGSVASAAPTGLHRFALDDVYRLAGLASPQISPDGTRVLVVVRTADREHDRWQRRLELIDVATHDGRSLPIDDERFASPRWSPDGSRIAYLAGGAVWTTDATGAEAHRVTGAAYDVVQFAWRPDGSAIAFAATARGSAKAGDDRYLDAYEVGNDAALARGPQLAAHLYLQPLDESAPRALGPARGTVAWGDAESTLSFSPDGAMLAYLWAPDAVGNDAVAARILLVDVASGRNHPFAALAGHVRDPLFSPDGTRFAYALSDGDAQVHPTEAFVAPAGGGAARAISRSVDRSVHDLAWEPHSSALDFTADDGVHSTLYRSVDGGPARPVSLGGLNVGSGLDGAFAANGRFAFVGRSGEHADELYLRSPSGVVEALTGENDMGGSVQLPTTARITYRTSLGVRADAVLVRPVGFRPGVRFPLVVVLHGGPTSASIDSFDPLAELMAARDWLVLEPNYRGSDNLGARYQSAIGGDKLRGPGTDIDAAIAAVRALGIVDDSRLAVSGWSYGAGLTLWMIEHRHDWRAAVAGAAVSDIAADYATADDIAADRALLGGSPLVGARRAAGAAMSPITYADRVRTPLLLMTCRGDSRVSPVGVYEFFHALRDLGRPVQLVAYPIDGHFPGDPVRRVDVYRRWVAFIAERFGA
jgi:dipeptidyl aminopeptidase/acylaminoacyl peptidase